MNVELDMLCNRLLGALFNGRTLERQMRAIEKQLQQIERDQEKIEQDKRESERKR